MDVLGPVLATYEAANGWRVTIHDGAPQLNGRHVRGPIARVVAMARWLIWSDAWTGRNGTTVITSPTGQQVVSGYWMDWREVEWGLSWLRYRTMTRRDRAALEVHQQATAYLPLSENFQSAWAYPERRLPTTSKQITPKLSDIIPKIDHKVRVFVRRPRLWGDLLFVRKRGY